MEATTENNDPKAYGGRPFWQWLLIYVVIGVVVYFLVYYFIFAQKGGGNYGGSPAPQSSPSVPYRY